jgi:hypothetical protein
VPFSDFGVRIDSCDGFARTATQKTSYDSARILRCGLRGISRLAFIAERNADYVSKNGVSAVSFVEVVKLIDRMS